MVLEGKGCYIWRVENCEGGNPSAIAARAEEARFTHVLVKIADGAFAYNVDLEQKLDRVPPVADALRAKGIQIWGWHYVYGDAPVGEARRAIQRVRELELDGYVVDAEAEYKDPAKKLAARQFMGELRRGLGDLPIALTSYRFPSYHPQLPWREFLERCDLNMPQIYWEFNHNPGPQLTRSLREFQDLVPFRPVVPVGPAYRRGPWQPSGEEIVTFMRTAQSLNLSGANFWEWSRVRNAELAEVWETLRDFPWAGVQAPSDIVERYVGALNAHDPDQVIGLYDPAAAHVTSNHTISGPEQIRAWYQNLFRSVLPRGVFSQTGTSGAGNSRHFTWTATSDQGEVHNGSDVFGLLGGKIVYHYTFFTVSK